MQNKLAETPQFPMNESQKKQALKPAFFYQNFH